MIFVSGAKRAQELSKLLSECNFPATCIFGALSQEERLARYNQFKEYKSRILVSTDLFGRGALLCSQFCFLPLLLARFRGRCSQLCWL